MSSPFLLAGELVERGARWEIRSPWSGAVVGTACVGSADDVRMAIDAAHRAAPEARRMPAHARAEVLRRIRAGIEERRDELTRLLAQEAGKPITAARAEVTRLLATFQDGIDESKRMDGELLPLDAVPAGAGRTGLVRRFPLAPIAAITPFNFPLNLAAHKLAPAIACGATIVLKPPPQDPLTSLVLAEIIAGAGYPKGAVSIVPCEVDDAAALIDDPRIRMITFTGSARAGWGIRARATGKKVTLELGGNAAAIIEPDADLEHAVKRCATGGFAYAGQSCISVQRILVHADVAERFTAMLVSQVSQLRAGDPMDEATDVGPMIDEANARRAEAWVSEAVSAGAQVATGGARNGSVLDATVLLGTTAEMKVNTEEVFAPIVTVRSYTQFDEALALANDSPYGLQAGLFTYDIRRIMRAFEELDVGGIIVNDVPSWRVDQMPYGGVKMSGLGREGVRYAIEDMTEPRLLVL
ncbi:MAG TPA: aldehyde dehydrogenase family protein [Gemmatimonadales bacterium]|nr:aldehyde dehydrogenase family protein [Gemmatimonadales bacterium]